MTAPEACYRHPARAAVEHCEQCRRPVCAACLWYAESGQRLCPDHAADALHAGQEVIPPERYAEGILHSQVSASRPAGPPAPYAGNSTDVNALIAAVTGVGAILACAGLSWVTPLFGLGLGIAALANAHHSLNPSRTRLLAMLGTTTSGVIVVLTLFIFMVSTACILAAVAAAIASGQGGP